MDSLSISFAIFRAALRDFSDLVTDKQYEKINYTCWRDISKERKDSVSVLFEWDERGVDILIADEYFYFWFGDNSFGDFLWENVLPYGSSYRRGIVPSLSAANGLGISSATTTTMTAATHSNENELQKKIDELTVRINEITHTEKENCDNMKGFNFDFGPVNSTIVRMSVYGMAVKNKAGTYVSYDAKNGEIMDVDVFNFDGAKFLYKLPVPIKDVAIGDVIVHMNVPMFVVGKSEDGKAVYAVDPVAGERKEIMLTKSPFGFNFVTKVVNFLGNAFNADASNPFGNLGLMMALSEGGNDAKDMLPLMMMANGGNIDMSNPFVMYALMGNDGKMGEMFPYLFLMNGNGVKHECHCKGDCGGHQ